MPKATSVVSSERHELKTLPGGFVEVRRLTYGQKLERKAMTANATMNMDRSKRDVQMMMQLMNENATIFDFKHCIVDHNLEDEGDRKLDLTTAADIRKLDPRIGEEIEQILDNLNNFEEDDPELGN